MSFHQKQCPERFIEIPGTYHQIVLKCFEHFLSECCKEVITPVYLLPYNEVRFVRSFFTRLCSQVYQGLQLKMFSCLSCGYWRYTLSSIWPIEHNTTRFLFILSSTLFNSTSDQCFNALGS